MSYVKNTWATGDVVTADKLNHIEDGIASAGGILPIGVTIDTDPITSSTVQTLDHTWQEIYNAAQNKVYPVVFKLVGGDIKLLPVAATYGNDRDGYTVVVTDPLDNDFIISYQCTEADEYPRYIAGGK